MNEIIIIGGGFAGLAAAKKLARHSNIKIKLIDKKNHHLFQPLLYQVATAGLNPADISHPIRSIFAKYVNVDVVLGEVHEIIPTQKFVRLKSGVELFYDYLIVASGARHAYFGNHEWEQIAPGLKTLSDAIQIRERILSAFEMAETTSDQALQRELLTFIVVGAGPTGVELAGAISELTRFALAKDYKNIKPDMVKVFLIEAAPRILSSFSDSLADKTLRYLTDKKKVHVLTNTKVTGLAASGVLVDQQIIPARQVIWAAGVLASEIGKTIGASLDSAGRVKTKKDLSLLAYPEVFIAGDLLSFELEGGALLPGVATAALQTGACAAENIVRRINGKNTMNFIYKDKGSLATVGRTFAIAQLGFAELAGLKARILWVVVHIFYLIEFKNKVFVLLQWTWAFFTFKKGARHIVQKLPFGDKSM